MRQTITILFNNKRNHDDVELEGYVISFAELVSMIKNKSLIKHFFRYKEANFMIYHYNSVPWPFINAVILRLLSRGQCAFVDDQGTRHKITFRRILSLFIQAARDFIHKRKLIAELEQEVTDLIHLKTFDKRDRIDLAQSSIYLRTDMWFGVTAGGSVGHIAGVLNHLDQFSGKPIFFTTDHIPTVREDLDVHVILPNQRYRDFRELSSLNFNRTFFQSAHQHMRKMSISFIYQRYSMNNYSGAKLAQQFNVPFVLEYNGSEIWISKNWGGKRLKFESLSEKIEELNFHAADLIVVVSEPIKDQLTARGVNPAKILVNPNGVDPVKYSPDIQGEAVRQKFGLKGKTVIGFIGTFGRWHGAEVLAEAFGLLMKNTAYKEQLRLLMIGDGVTMTEVRALIEKYDMKEQCVLTGIVPQEEGPAHLAACDILASPHVPNADGTPFFGSPTKLFEYMAMGKGIVASDLDQIGEVLEHGRTAWLVKPGDADALASGLSQLIEQPEIRAELGRQARRTAIEHHTWLGHTSMIIQALKLTLNREGGA